MLGAIANTTAVGLYAPVLRLVDAIWLAVVVFGAYYLPVASAIVGSGDLGQLRSVYTTMTKWAVALVAPALAVLLVAPVPVLTLVFGPPFRETGLLSQVLAIGYVVSVLGGFNGATLVALGRTKAIAIRSTAALALNLTVNAILIPRLGALGAAVGTSIAYVGLNVANSYLIWRVARVHPLRRDFLAVVGASALAVAATIPVLVILDWWRSLAGSLLVAAVVGVASLGTAILTAGPEERDLMRLRNVLPRRFVKSSGSHH
jgi:O-antigen/teichoic acid export membrane protein